MNYWSKLLVQARPYMGLTSALSLRRNARHCSSPRSGSGEAFAPERGKMCSMFCLVIWTMFLVTMALFLSMYLASNKIGLHDRRGGSRQPSIGLRA